MTFGRDTVADVRQARRAEFRFGLADPQFMESFFLDESRRLRTIWRFAIFGFGFVAVQSIASLPVVLGFFVYLRMQGIGLDTFLTNPHLLDEWQVPLQIAAAVPITVCDAALVIFCRRYLDERSVASLGFVKPGHLFFNSVVGGLLTGGLPIISVIGILLALGWLTLEGVSGSLQTALLVPTLVVMAFNEEILCRGYLLQNLVDIRRPAFGILLSSFIFWILHALNPAAWSSPIISLNLFGAGVALALAYRVSGNIWFPTAMHFGWNFAQGVLFDVPVSGLQTDGLVDVRLVQSAPAWLTGGSFGVEGSLLATGAELAISLVLAFAPLKRSREAPAEAAAETSNDTSQTSIFLPDDAIP